MIRTGRGWYSRDVTRRPSFWPRAVAAVFFLGLQLISSSALADETESPSNPPQVCGTDSYTRPRPFEFLTNVPGDIKTFAKTTFTRKHAPVIGLIVVGTTLLILTDRWTQFKAREAGSRLGITPSQHQETFATIPLPGSKHGLQLEGPFDNGSSLYFIGDGMVDLGLAGGFLGYGAIAGNNRAMRTSSGIVEAIIGVGLVEQVVKRTTGRPSPLATDHDADMWRFFPNQRKFQAHVATYDAFPSGHLGAGVATLTVIASNYPEYHFIRPVGITLLTVLAFQMMNNGVHWAGDYPLAIGIGYAFGRIASMHGKGPVTAGALPDWQVYPLVSSRLAGLSVTHRFGAKAHHPA